jgi:hypothetical protein
LWAIFGDGSGSGINFCFLCNAHRDHKAAFKPACDDCKRRHPVRKFCRHEPICDRGSTLPAESLPTYPLTKTGATATMAEVKAFLTRANVPHDSKMKADALKALWDQWNSQVRLYLWSDNPQSTNFVVNGTEQRVAAELKIRGVSVDKIASLDVDEKKQVLIDLMWEEYRHLVSNRVISDHCLNDPSLSVMDPLHFELRMGSRLMTLMLQHILDRGSIPADGDLGVQNMLTKEEKKIRLKAIESHLNTCTFNTKSGSNANIKIKYDSGTVA